MPAPVEYLRDLYPGGGEGCQDMPENVAEPLGKWRNQHQGVEITGPPLGGDRGAGLIGPGNGEIGSFAQGDHPELGHIEVAAVVPVEQENVARLNIIGQKRPVAGRQVSARVLALAAEVHAEERHSLRFGGARPVLAL